MNKKIKFLKFFASFSLAIIPAISLPFLSNEIFSKTNNTISINETSNDASDSTTQYPIVASQSNGQNSFLSTKNGPLVYWNNKITSLDWFGGERWSLEMDKYVSPPSNKGYTGSWKRAWYNWDYDRTRDILWVLGNGSDITQKLFEINASDGNIIKQYEIPKGSSDNSDSKFITALVSGDVLVYGGASSPSYNGKAWLLNKQSGTFKEIVGNSGSISKPDDHNGTSKMYLYNIIPIAKNKNIVCYMNFPTTGGATTGDNSSQYASFNVYFTLTNDNLDMITNSSTNDWSKPMKIVDGVKGFRNSKITPQRDYYTLLDGRVVTILYNTIVIIDPSDVSGAKIYKYQLDATKWVLSWTFDTNENLFFKYKDHGDIYRVSSDSLKPHSAEFSQSTYYSLSSSADYINKYANNYVLYNVYGYQGQIMAINSWYSDTINIYDSSVPNDSTIIANQYGLAIAITENENDSKSGDSKGSLNGANSFQVSADFDISESVLNTKIPSEITKNDLILKNGGFLTENKTLNETTGKLKYPPFSIADIKDSEGTFTIKVNLDQIPWFANSLPKDATPKEIIKKFSTTQKITNKISWKESAENDYDFKNTLPTKIDDSDILKFDPFQVSFNSQVILDSSGNQLYPKKYYIKETADDSKGTITLKVNYEYVPLGVSYNSKSDVLTFTQSKQYNVFSSSSSAQFYFAGATSAAGTNNQEIDIRSVPQLKSLSESKMLPSAFNASNKDSFLQFINTSKSIGYPISKMNFKVSANDQDGKLTVIATMPSGYFANNQSTSFTQVFSGFNKKQDYTFSFNNTNTINGTNFSLLLPSSINEGDIIKNLVNYTGFNSSDFSVELNPNNANGTLGVTIVLNSSYASSLGNSNGFENYRIFKQFNGFMTTNDYNNQYLIEFKANNDASLAKIKQMTLSEIDQALNKKDSSKYIEVNGEKYNNLKDFVQNVLIGYVGEKIPGGKWSENEKIEAKMTFDNNAGTMNILLTIKKEVLSGLESDLNIVASYSGFSKGNINVTEDNLSFIDNDLLKTVVTEANNTTASKFAEWLKGSNSNLRKIISHISGVYDSLIKENKYTLELEANDSYGTLSVTIIFNRENISNSNSLASYSIQYFI